MPWGQVKYDLVIIGGGINGAALARQAAFHGLKCAVFEAGDFGQGASTNTSKLLHGGLRYLETYDFALVRDATRERAQLLALAPHVVEARRFLFPRTRMGRHGRPLIKAGMSLYDFLAGRLKIEPHGWVSPLELRRREPQFLPGEETGGYEYSDCVMDDSRLVMENLIDAAGMGAEIRNYHRLLGAEPGGDGNLDVTLENRLAGKETVLSAAKVALALGPWTDEVARSVFPGAKPQVTLSQGIHIVVAGLASESCFILPVPGSRRYFFVVPWKGRHLVGTTETQVGDHPPEPLVPLEREVTELQGLLKLYFPDQTTETICTFTGLRPLARASRGSTITLSREHEFHTLSPGVFSAVGGKYTTHRTLAREYLKYILGGETKIRDLDRRPFPGAWGGDRERQELRSKLLSYPFTDKPQVEAWMHRYGVRAVTLAEFISASPERQVRLQGSHPLLAGEVRFAIEFEWAKSPVDFFRRRTDLYFMRDAGLEALAEVEAMLEERNPSYRKTLGREADYTEFLRRNRHRAAP